MYSASYPWVNVYQLYNGCILTSRLKPKDSFLVRRTGCCELQIDTFVEGCCELQIDTFVEKLSRYVGGIPFLNTFAQQFFCARKLDTVSRAYLERCTSLYLYAYGKWQIDSSDRCRCIPRWFEMTIEFSIAAK